MKISESWLREWVNPPISTEALVAQLTGAGLEVDGVEPVAGEVGDVVVAEVISVAPHPNADRLRLCAVTTGGSETFSVVCGAPNVRNGLRTAFAPVGARIGEGTKIKKSKIRGVVSEGMLCSARELGIGESADGIMELSDEAVLGIALAEHLNLDDNIIEIDLTPNRGECLGIAGIAREVGALNRFPVMVPDIPLVKGTVPDRSPVALEAPADCPRYVGRVILGIDRNALTPNWLAEKLRRSGVRPISPVVDVTNFVMLELGQPMHAFDWRKLEGGIRVRKATDGETLSLLDGREVDLHESTLVIADDKRPVALAGIMGGLNSSVTEHTDDIFLESAFFSPKSLIGEARRYGLHTEASHRFERGVDPELQRRAAERATELLLSIVGGEPGAIVDQVSAPNMPRRNAIRLRAERLRRLLGMEVPAETVTDSLERLGMVIEPMGEDWQVTPPSYRFDVSMEADLVEEVARMVGYDTVPSVGLSTIGNPPQVPEAVLRAERIREALVARGYHEAVTYSFVDEEAQKRFDPESPAIALANPISSDMSVMRTSLWPGLFDALVRNLHRQHARVRLFETGLSFSRSSSQGMVAQSKADFAQIPKIVQAKCLAGILSGSVMPEQWGAPSRPCDFYDVKGDLETILALTGRASEFRFLAARHPALHPGQSAEICRGEVRIGWIGALHPEIAQARKVNLPVFLFHLSLGALENGAIPRYETVSKFPWVRRDIAFILDDAVSAEEVRSAVGQVSPDVLKNLEFFDVYRGEGIDSGKKSVAVGLTFQSSSRTLTDEEIDGFVDKIVAFLRREFGADLRG